MEPLQRPVTELARLIREGELSSSELVESSLARIDELNPRVNAFVVVDEDRARAAAAEIAPGDPRPFAGVPIAIKDVAPVAGLPYSVGSQLFGDFVPAHDSHTVRRIREAGFVIVGKTNLPEFGILPVTEPRRFGPARNPWDLERTPGGSSGGSAAAVAGGLVPIAHGSDGGGSTRIPAACCGLVGLKATRNRISRGPDLGEDHLTGDGVLTRTVEETALLLDLLHGYETGDANWVASPPEPFAKAARREPARLRVGLTTTPPLETELDPVAERAAHDAAELLAELGHDVTEIDSPPWSGQDLLPVFTRVFGAHISMAIAFGGIVTAREPTPELMEPLSWAAWERARETSSVEYLLARVQLDAMTRAVVGMWSEIDVLLTPALGQRPVAIGEIDACSAEPWEDFRRSGAFTPFTAIFNVSGQPAISLPLFHGDDGLPLGVQLAAAPAREDVLLSLGAQLERARPWVDRRPELAVT